MFLTDAPMTDDVRDAFDRAKAEDGYLSNHTRLWAWRSDLDKAFTDLRVGFLGSTSLSERERVIVVSAAVSAFGDSYCSLAWGSRLAALIGDEPASRVVTERDPDVLTTRERALAQWVRKVARDPNSTKQRDVDELRAAGFGDREIFEATALAALRLAFSTVNDALGCPPDREIFDGAPADVRSAVSFGRAVVGPVA
jgi:uncharacterized peroxidase-related enzyme